MATTLSRKPDRLPQHPLEPQKNRKPGWRMGVPAYARPSLGERLPELLAMLLVSVLLVAGVLQVSGARLERSLTASLLPPLQLQAITGPHDLEPVLAALYPPGPDQALAASALWSYLEAQGGASQVQSVWQLRNARVDAEQIEKNPRLLEFGSRLTRARAEHAASFADRLGDPGQLEERELELSALHVLTLRQMRELKPRLAARSGETFREVLEWSVVLVLLGSWLPLLLWIWRGQRPDPWVLPLATALSGLGLMMMISLRDPLRDALILSDFSQGIAIGGLLLALASQLDVQRLGLRRFTWLPLVGALLLSAAVLLVGSGPGTSDARVNLRMLGFTVQPVEAVKLLMVLFLAGFFTQRWEQLRSLHVRSSLAPRLSFHLAIPRRQDLMPVLVGMLGAVAFLFLQKDLGPALVLAATFLGLYSLARGRFGLALFGLLLLGAGCVSAWLLRYPATVFNRMEMVLHPWDNLRTGGDQLAMGLWALAAGGLGGTGLGWGESARVPAAHTDFILAAVGEELGWMGVCVALLLYAALIWRGLHSSLHAEADYPLLLGAGLTLMLAAQLLLIASGVLGVMPLSGVTSPLLSFGRSSQWTVYLCLGVWLAISEQSRQTRLRAQHLKLEPAHMLPSFRRPLRLLGGLVGLGLLLLAGRAFSIQVLLGDDIMVRPLLAAQAGDEVGYVPNPRLKAIADAIPRGTLFDRQGLPLASSDRAGLEAFHGTFGALGVDLDSACPDRTRRCYPLEGLSFHLLGDLRAPRNWAAPNSDFIEKKYDVHLQGFNDHARVVEVTRQDGRTSRELLRDYSELLPLWRLRHAPHSEEVRAVLERNRDLELTLDARLQLATRDALLAGLQAARKELGKDAPGRAAAILLNADSGAVLAMVSLPYPKAIGAALIHLPDDDPALFDRPRFGLYPPGSTFKPVTALAALRKDRSLEQTRYTCKPLGNGRVGILMPGKRRPIRDDILDKEAHGEVDLRRGMAVSCNAYFAQLATFGAGAASLLDTADIFGIQVARPNTVKHLEQSLAQAGFGQGEVLAHPLQLVEVAATLANGGKLVKATELQDRARANLELWSSSAWRATAPTEGPPQPGSLVMDEAGISSIAVAMREVVLSGSGRRVRELPGELPIAGKTGTAEVEGQASHAWFVGFAPYLEPGTAPGGGGSSAPSTGAALPGSTEGLQRVAFVVLLENTGYGGRFAAPIARAMVNAAQKLGLAGRAEHSPTQADSGASHGPAQAP